jgi:hypothetical protein
MENVKNVQDDLTLIKTHSHSSKESLQMLKDEIVKKQMQVLALERKKRNVKKVLIIEKVI